jgi:hypothetical protein
MGFGEKIDYQTQRTLNLDKTYEYIIKRAVTGAGLECVRADAVMHSGVIEQQMYEQLLGADLVIADLSTSNANAIYELGVRHALRPNTTIVIAESQFKCPFDFKSLLIRQYEHLGKGIDFGEAERMRADLETAIVALVNKAATDSPVYTYLHELAPPSMRTAPAATQNTAAQQGGDPAYEALRRDTTTALAKDDFITAKALLKALLERRVGDPYVVQRLALCTYKAKLPDPQSALLEARSILQALQPRTTADAETLGLWGAIHKRLWDLNKQRPDLDESIWAYERGFYLRQDYYTGINYAFMLNERADVSARAEAIADFVTAQRVRGRVMAVCDSQLAQGIKDDAGNSDPDAEFWVLATLIESHVGVGDEAKALEFTQRAQNMQRPKWMYETLNTQLGKLRPLLQRQAALTRF